MTREGEREIVKVEKPSGGEGYILKEALLGAEELGAHCKMFSKVTLPHILSSGTMNIMERRKRIIFCQVKEFTKIMARRFRQNREMYSSVRTETDTGSATTGKKMLYLQH